MLRRLNFLWNLKLLPIKEWIVFDFIRVQQIIIFQRILFLVYIIDSFLQRRRQLLNGPPEGNHYTCMEILHGFPIANDFLCEW